MKEGRNERTKGRKEIIEIRQLKDLPPYLKSKFYLMAKIYLDHCLILTALVRFSSLHFVFIHSTVTQRSYHVPGNIKGVEGRMINETGTLPTRNLGGVIYFPE